MVARSTRIFAALGALLALVAQQTADAQRRTSNRSRSASEQVRAQAAIGTVNITRIVPNDDSVLVEFQIVPGAVDYRIYDVNDTSTKKYAGQFFQYPSAVGGTVPYDYALFATSTTTRSIEWNGVDTVNGATLVVEAVDALGPYKEPLAAMARMEACHCPGGHCGDACACDCEMVLNGHGAPTNVPNVIARSAQFRVTTRPRTMTGSQVWFENFRNAAPFVKTGNNPRVPYSQFQGTNEYIEWDNGRILAASFGADPSHTGVFVDKGHFMDVTADNIGVTNASMLIHPKAQFDISNGRVLHVTWEVDARFTSRRWCNVIVTRAGDPVSNPGKLDTPPWNYPTLSGDEFRWECQFNDHFAQVFRRGVPTEVGDIGWGPNGANWREVARVFWDYYSPMANGTSLDIDKRHKFDLYLSKTSCMLVESNAYGQVLNTVRRVFPAGVTLPFEQCEVSFVHQVYHTALEHEEMEPWKNQAVYWYYQTPSQDERHWDNIGIEVLDAGTLPDTMPPAINVTNPAAGAELNGPVTITTASQDDRAVTRTEIYVDGTLISNSPTASWDASTTTDGDHAIVAKAYDAAGNVGISPVVMVRVRNVATTGGDCYPFHIVFNPNPVRGGTPSTATLIMSKAAPAGGVNVKLTSEDISLAQVPGSVKVPGGADRVSFPVTTFGVTSVKMAVVDALCNGASIRIGLDLWPAAPEHMAFNPSPVRGGNRVMGTVFLNGVAPAGGLQVSLFSERADLAPVPATVTVPAGSNRADFPIVTSPVNGPATAVIQAVAGGKTIRIAFDLMPAAPEHITFAANPSRAGGIVMATLLMNGVAPLDGVEVQLQSENPNVATVPATVLIPRGADRVTFPIQTKAVTVPTDAVIAATASGMKIRIALTVRP